MNAPPVPLLDLRAQLDSIRDEVMAAIEGVVDSQRFILGPEVRALEEEIAAYCGAADAVGVSSGSDALLISLMAYGIGPGDEVVTTPYTFFATVGCIHRAGARPVFADIDPASFNIDPGRVEAAITPRTRAIIPVDLYGRAADLDPIVELAAARGIPVIEDAAQSIGAEHRGRRAGGICDTGCFSFYPAKNLGAFGDGGMVTVRDPELAATLRVLRDHGARPKYHHSLVGGNFRLDAIQAAVLRVKLRRLDAWTEARRRNAADYIERFTAAGLAGDALVLPEIPADRHVFNQFILRARDRDGLVGFLAERGIGHEIYYPLPLHLQECFRYLGHGPGDFPEAERAARETVAIPVFPELTGEQRARVVEVIEAFYRR